LYRCHDLLLPLKEELFSHLKQRWSDLFGARYEVVLYDLTSTCFECDVPSDETDPRRFGYSRDKRSDCVQVVVALVVTPEGLPLAYEMFPGNTTDKTTLRGMLATIRRRYGAAERIWVMDRGIPTEKVLTELRADDSTVRYLVGTTKGRLTRDEAALAEQPWREVRPQLRVKLLPCDGEVYVLAESGARAGKERGMRKRKLKRYWERLKALGEQAPPRDVLLKKLGAAQERAGRLATDDPELIWRCYLQLCFVEEAFRTLKGDLGLRPIFHQRADRIEAHLFIAFLAYCLSITLRQKLRTVAGGLMPRTVFEKLATVQLLDVIVPTTDKRELLLVRRTEPDRDVALLLAQLNLELPPQPPPRISAPQAL
jgi:Transposase DDE domain